MEALTAEGQLNAYLHNGFWKCVDTSKDHVELESHIKESSYKFGRFKDKAERICRVLTWLFDASVPKVREGIVKSRRDILVLGERNSWEFFPIYPSFL